VAYRIRRAEGLVRALAARGGQAGQHRAARRASVRRASRGGLDARAPGSGGKFTGDVGVALEQTSRAAASRRGANPGIAGDWKNARSLEAFGQRSRSRAWRFVTGVGTVWIDQASLIPGDTVDGVRADVLEVRALSAAFIRWPGGNVARTTTGAGASGHGMPARRGSTSLRKNERSRATSAPMNSSGSPPTSARSHHGQRRARRAGGSRGVGRVLQRAPNV
jgi:hypothetical protein